MGLPQKVELVASVSSGYRLSSNDLIHIRVFQEDELETVARVGRDGTIPFPMLGTLSVGGKTLPETTSAVTLALKEYLVRPQVAVRVVEYTKRKFTVLGQVNRPGTFDLPDEVSDWDDKNYFTFLQDHQFGYQALLDELKARIAVDIGVAREFFGI